MERLGMGARRACYGIPGTGLCVKCYRSDAEIAEGKYPGQLPVTPLAPAVVREIGRRRFDGRRNTSCQEYRYWLSLKRRLPAGLMTAFPATMEPLLLPSRGWCIVEEVVLNADGSGVKRFHEALSAASPGEQDGLFTAFDRLVDELCRHAVRFYDPQNILVQRCADGAFRLRITDFEPVSRTLISLDRLSPSFARLKIRRRFLRYRRLFGIVRKTA